MLGAKLLISEPIIRLEPDRIICQEDEAIIT